MPALHTLFMNAIAEERDATVSRRTLLGTGSKLAVGGAVAFAAAGSPALARLVAAQAFTDDIDVLNYALTLEHLEYAFYRDGLAAFSADVFEAGVYDNLLDIRDHEDAHVDALVSTIESLGGTPVEEATYDFGYQNAGGFLAVAAALENTGVSAYDGAAASIENVDLLNAAGSIVAVEARHASYLNLINGEDPFPAAFETPLSRDEILAIAGPFIVQ
ncbi:MAG: ferritin-like domain-containing protein [Thermomicrobiales bacterium]